MCIHKMKDCKTYQKIKNQNQLKKLGKYNIKQTYTEPFYQHFNVITEISALEYRIPSKQSFQTQKSYGLKNIH